MSFGLFDEIHSILKEYGNLEICDKCLSKKQACSTITDENIIRLIMVILHEI